MGNGLPGQPFDHFKLFDVAPSTPITFGKYKAYTGPGGTGTVLRDQRVVDSAAPGNPLPVAILNPGQNVSDAGLSLPGVESVVIDVQPQGWAAHTTTIQWGAGDELKYVEIRFKAISASTGLYLLQVYLVSFDPATDLPRAEVSYPKWI